MPLILDNIIVFLVQSILLLLREQRTKQWPITTGTVLASYGPELTPYPEAQLVYKYEAEGERWTGTYTRPFYFSGSAKKFADQFAPSTTLYVRYKPGHASSSFIRREDQSGRIAPSASEVSQF